jgi:cytochrome c oxidase assembly protein subunit 11
MTGGNGQQQDKRKRGGNARVALLLAGVVCGMVGLSFAAVPLYRIFCQVTGLGGTTQQADALPDEAIERMITVRFNADIDSSLTFYKAASLADFPTTGHATYNVTPLKAGLYFNKIHCFCFDEQTLAGGEEVDMGVNFFIDPAINEDPNLDDVQTITLSYTFFRTPEDQENGGEKSEQLTHFNDGEGAKAEAGTIN